MTRSLWGKLRNVHSGPLKKLFRKYNDTHPALREDEFAAQLLEAIPSPIFYKDAAGRYVGCNRAFEEAIGIPRAELIGKTVFDVVPRDPAHSAVDQALFDGSSPIRCESSMIYADGSKHDVMVHQAVFRNKDGSLGGWVGVVLDLTERKRAEAERMQAEICWAAVIESAMDAVISIDAEQRLVQFNPAAERMFGYRPEEILGQPLDILLPRSLREHHREQIDRFGQTGQTSRRMGALGRIVGCRKGGEEFPLEAAISHIRMHGEQLFTVILRDVTQRARDEQAIRELNESLEQRVLQRTAELERINQELEAFSYSISHDLRAPLRAITGFASILRDESKTHLASEQHDLLTRIERNAERMAKLIDDVLDFAHVARRPLAADVVNMTGLARSVVEELRQLYPAAQTNVEAMPVASGDAGMLRQVYVNLIGNAFKFSSKHALPRISIGAEKRDDNTVFFVRDNGVGFDLTHATRLFQVFRRFHSESEFPGTGVGLAIAKRIIERHGGKIWAESAPDNGATFFFILQPMAVDSAIRALVESDN